MKFKFISLLFLFSLTFLYAQEAKKEPFFYYPQVEKTLSKKSIVAEVEIYKYLFVLFFSISTLLLFGLFFYRREFMRYKKRVHLPVVIKRDSSDEIAQKEELISYVSHELRTPMTAITGLIHLLLESNLKPLQKDYLTKIEKASDYMLSLLNDILDLAKIEAGKLQLEKTEFNLNDIINYIYNIVSVQAKNSNLNIVVLVDKNVTPHILGDPLRLGQILINLMSNAIKFTKEGEVTLEVKKVSSEKETITLEFIISDTGIGMTKEQMQRLFNSFYQAEDSTSRKYGGSGLGLNISKNLVEMMGGEISVDSKKGFGSTFRFQLEFTLKDYNEKRQYRLPNESLLNKNILLIDACNKNAIPLTQALSYFKYRVHNIPTIDALSQEREEDIYDLVIINLQNLNETTREKIQLMQKRQNFKIVILSPLYSSLNADFLQDFMVDAYLKPPITIQNVLNLIIELYQKPQVANTRKDLLIDLLKKYKGKQILVVEDEELNYKVIAGMLAKTGIETTYAESGEKALELLTENINFDLVLMDINMSGLDGYETAEKIRQNSALDNMPIIALSADNSHSAMQKALECGMQAYLLKPIKLNYFYSKIIELLKKQKH